MALPGMKPPDNFDSQPEPCDVIELCPVCGGRMETVYDRHHQKVCVCVDCHSGVTVPVTAWDIARAKRQAKPKPKQ